ncbi:MAG: T9SS type A sorting domain-containing protein [Candidatus Eisenbacteria bacterium]
MTDRGMPRRYAIGLLVMSMLVCSSVAVAVHGKYAHTDSARGTTTPLLIRSGEWSDLPGATADQGSGIHPRREPLAVFPGITQSDSDWVLIDTDTFFVRLPVDEACAIRFDCLGESLEVLLPPDALTSPARQAVEYAPDWLALELEDAFARMNSGSQDTYAGIILGTPDPIVDEIAFVIAHTATQVLQSVNFKTQILTENAEDVYGHDPFIDYADIVDYGSAAAGGNYYSTVLYRTAETGDTLEIELPRERYYWDIVHLKISDEFPTYINPATGAATDPPVGRFWREFLFAHADSGYPALKDELAGCGTLWEGQVNSLANGAVGIMSQWILDVMDFGSGVERPIQPVRIYRKHLGRCGEHADITAAAARAALIATNSPLSMASDHTWNEFWDQRWVHWEPVNVYVDSPWSYEGWGKVFLGIFNWQGDDGIWTVTERYTPHCTLTVAVSDSFGYPVDGAQVTIARKTSSITYYESTWGSTGHDGLCRFLLGDETDVYARIDSDLGTIPPGPLYKLAVDSSAADSHYTWVKSLPNHRPQVPVQAASLPAEPTDSYQLRLSWEAVGEFCYGDNRLNNNTFSDHITGGAVEFFVCDAPNYAAYATSDSFLAYNIIEDADSVELTFTFPTHDEWYAVLSNEEHVVSSQLVRGTAHLYARPSARVASGSSPGTIRLDQTRPNPFTSETWISYSVGREAMVDLAIYDVTGRRVTTLVSERVPYGDHRVCWNGLDAFGRPVASGVYLLRVETPERRLSHKVVFVR